MKKQDIPNVSKVATAVVIIPTYNEAGTIGYLLDRLFFDVFPTIEGWRMKVLVVDGHSSDGTGQIVEECTRNMRAETGTDDLYLLSEESKDGIGAAYVKGFRYAMEKLSADVVIECDGDFQHPPESIPDLLTEIDNGFDYVVGSRSARAMRHDVRHDVHHRAGGYRRDFLRTFLTKYGGWCARLILFFPKRYFFIVTDPTTGFKATRVKGFVDRLNLDPEHLYSKKFGYKVQLLSETLNLGAKYKETPLRLERRRAGVSKFETWKATTRVGTAGSIATYGTIGEVFLACFLTRWHDPKTRIFCKYSIIGAIGYGINAVLLQLFSVYSGIEILAWTFSTEAAIVSNFMLNNIWTFRAERIVGVNRYLSKFLQFNLLSVGAFSIEVVLGTWGVMIFGGRYRQIILLVIVICAVIPYNWLIYTKMIWKTK